MKKFIMALASSALLIGAGCQSEAPSTSIPEAVMPIKDANLAAVLIYADWCGSCKILDPKINNVKNTHSFKGTAFVTLDYTAKDDAAFFADAQTAGVAQAVRDHLGGTVKTGQLLLIDMDDKKVIGVVKKDMNEPAIAKAIEVAASAA